MRALILASLALFSVAACDRSGPVVAPYEVLPPTQAEIDAAPLDPLVIPPVLTLPPPVPGAVNIAERDPGAGRVYTIDEAIETAVEVVAPGDDG